MRIVPFEHRAFGVFIICAAASVALPAQTFTTLFSFDGINGSNPKSALVQEADGNFYGTAHLGGNDNCPASGQGCGAIFRISTRSSFTELQSFCPQAACASGERPAGDEGRDNCTTQELECGSAFKMSASGQLATIYIFCPQGGSECPGEDIELLGNNLKGAPVSFNGIPAIFSVVSGTLITAQVPAGATSGAVQVVTAARTLSSSPPYQLFP